MKSFTQKKEELSKLKDKLAEAKIVVFSSFARDGENGLNVTDMRKLKNGLREINSEYFVEKKTLLDKALREAKPSFVKTSEGKGEIDVFQYPGSLGVVFGYGDEQSVAKSVYNFAKKYPALKYFGAIWNGKFMDLTQFTEFAKLPSKEVMIARLLGMMKYPIWMLAVVLNQISKKE